jgi:hypothetical protein
MKLTFRHPKEEKILRQIEKSERNIAEDSLILSLLREQQNKVQIQLYGRITSE